MVFSTQTGARLLFLGLLVAGVCPSQSQAQLDSPLPAKSQPSAANPEQATPSQDSDPITPISASLPDLPPNPTPDIPSATPPDKEVKESAKDVFGSTPFGPGGFGMGAGGFGGGGMGGFGGFGAGGIGAGGPGVGASYYPGVTVKGQPNDQFSLVREHIGGGIPIWQDGPDRLMLTAGVRNTLFNTDANLPQTNQPFPTALWAVNVGMSGIHKFDNGWTLGLTAGVGSASDKPFNGLDQMNVSLMSFLRIPVWNNRDAWMFSLMYAPVGAQTGNVPYPIPGVAYQWNPNDWFHMSIGLPFAIMWRPMEELIVNISYTPIVNANGRIIYRVTKQLNIYTGFDWVNEAYYLTDLPSKDRFMGYEKRLISGVRWNFWSHGSVDINGGYAFDRYYGEGTGSASSNLTNRVDLPPGGFVGTNLMFRW